ncbi:MAG: hypothetical protein ACI8RA_001671 [Chlamydiales bacterium]|jgi:hypothetical protein
MEILIKVGINNPGMACYAAAVFSGLNAGKELSNYLKYNKLPDEENISSLQDLSDKKDNIVLLKGTLSGEDISDNLTLSNEVRRCFQELTITHTFGVERIERVQHVQRSPQFPGIIDRTYTDETRIDRFSQDVTSRRVSAMSLRINVSGTYINIPIARPTQETVIVGDGHSSTLLHPDAIYQASLRCNRQERQEDSTYSISEKYLEIGKEISVHGKLLVHSLRGQADRFEIVEPTLISNQTKDKLKNEAVEGGVLSGVAAIFCAVIGYVCCKKKPKKD